MPEIPVDLAADQIEPELRTPPPRPTRLRPSMVRREFLLWSLLALSIAGSVGSAILPDLLVARFGHTVSAEVTYTLDPAEFSKPTPGKILLAHLTYEWQGIRHQEIQRIPFDPLKRFRSHTTIPVRVLGPWRVHLWPGDAGEASRRALRSRGTATALALTLVGGLLVWLGIDGRRRQKRLVREARAVVGRVVRYENLWKRSIQGPLPGRGIVFVHYEHPGSNDRLKPAEKLPRVGGRVPVRLPLPLPSLDGPVTVLVLRAGSRVRHGLYLANPYEAFAPPAVPTSTPDRGTG